jgi:hypothetical protein
MRGQAKWCWEVLLVMAFLVGSAAAPAGAQEKQVGQKHVGLSAGLYQPQEEDTDFTGVFGARAGYRFLPDFGFEASLSGADLAATLPDADTSGDPIVDFQFDFYALNLELSLQWFPKYSWSRNVIVFGGAGMSRLEADISGIIFDIPITDKDVSNIFTVHTGIAYDWRVGDRFFLRPELRYRYLVDDDEFDANDSFTLVYDASGPEANMIFGWRLDS